MQVLKTKLTTHSHLAAFEWLWPNPEYISFLHAFNKLLSVYSPETAIISVSDDLIYKRWEQEGNRDEAAEFYQMVESFFWKLDIAASINSEIEEEQRRAGALHTAPLHFCSSPEVRNAEAKFQERNGIAFMGYNNEANRLAIRWILSDLHTALRQRDDDITLHIIGTVEVPKGMCKRKRGCIHHGPLEDDMARAYISKVRWFVAPVFTDAGISTKILFSLTCGTPVLTTEKGLGGMPPINQSSTPFLVVNTTRTDYLDNFLAFYSIETIWQSKQSSTHRYVRDNLGCDRVTEDVRRIMQKAKDIQEKKNLRADIVTLPHLPLRVLWDLQDDKNSSISDLIATIREYHTDVIEILGTDGLSSTSSTGNPDIFIRFLWPPNFARPSCCPSSSCVFIVYQPWDMGFIPEIWKPLLQDVDAIWVPSLCEYSVTMHASSH
jgi:glycosyltransferase involved in cell wall biosynthesis